MPVGELPESGNFSNSDHCLTILHQVSQLTRENLKVCAFSEQVYMILGVDT